MAGSAQLWPGPKMRAFLRSILADEPGVDTDLADRLAQRCVKRIARMLVWDSSGADAPAGDARTNDAQANDARTGDATPTDVAANVVSGKDRPPPASTPQAEPLSGEPDQPSSAPSSTLAADTFDPFAFSVIVMLKRQGRAALMKRLEAVNDPAQLRKIAEAQHLGVDKSLRSARKLREAIITGAEQRLADRRAAAS
ncbi:MAG TPA: hypothetical protein P5114_03535 [Hyphomicrobiaceae bacterium]|nr:hypothetical protein [Hyphomicrobiaceae bacterium]